MLTNYMGKCSIHGAVQSRGGPPNHPFFPLIFHDINHPASLGYPHLSHPKLKVFVLKRISIWGSPMTMETLYIMVIWVICGKW